MPPQRTIIVDTDRMLTTIAAIAAKQHAAVVADHEAQPEFYYEGRLEAELSDAKWAPRDLQILAGKSLTASERIRHQQAIRRLADDGLVVLDTRNAKLTNAGLQHVAQLQEAAVDG